MTRGTESYSTLVRNRFIGLLVRTDHFADLEVFLYTATRSRTEGMEVIGPLREQGVQRVG